MIKLIITLFVMFASPSFLRAQPPVEQKLPADVQKAKEVIAAHLTKIKGSNGTILHISDESLAKTFPKHTFFAVRYRVFPVAEQRPEGMAASNVFAVLDGKLEHVKDDKALEVLFKSSAVLVTSHDLTKASISSWLALSQEFVQDGFYTFEIFQKEIWSFKDPLGVRELPKLWGAGGRAVVMKGGNGEITAEFTWSKEGKLLQATYTTKVTPGPRPICQATKLLDPDPVVRKMAEQDLLYMGLAARDYMMDQRAKAAPELRAAIDLLWDKILQNGW